MHPTEADFEYVQAQVVELQKHLVGLDGALRELHLLNDIEQEDRYASGLSQANEGLAQVQAELKNLIEKLREAESEEDR